MKTRVGLFVCALAQLARPCIATADDADLDRAIRANRVGTIVVQTRPGAEVRVEQLRHEFWFGAALAGGAFTGQMNPADAERYKTTFLANFNSAVTENALKWHAMEPRQGKVRHDEVEAILRWADENKVPVRGHNIFWGVPDRVQPWLKAMSDPELRAALEARARDIGTRYRGRFAEYDLNNEMVHANYYEERLGPDITRDMARWVREGDPGAVLYLNDYDILTGRRLDDYAKQIRGLLDQGVPIGGIGAQGHLHGDTFDPKALRDALDRLAEFHLPIRVTEFNFPGQRSRFHQDRNLKMTKEQEQAKARAIVEYYRICFAHPAVDGILMWGFWEGANWIPVSSLYRRDWSETPAAAAYRDLVFRQWWTRESATADTSGKCAVPAFFGTHRVTVDGQSADVVLAKSDRTVTVKLGKP
jgi:GH35 family endo-1,4-beta-xylanase